MIFATRIFRNGQQVHPISTGNGRLDFLRTEAGVLKLIETILGIFGLSLLLGFGHPNVQTLGAAFYISFFTMSSCLFTVLLLVFSYLYSLKSFYVLRESYFETAFNLAAWTLYLLSSTILGIRVLTVVQPEQKVTNSTDVYSEIRGVSILGVVTSLFHGYDAYKSYRHYHDNI